MKRSGKPKSDASADGSMGPNGRPGQAPQGAGAPHRLSREVQAILREEALFSGAVLPRAGNPPDGELSRSDADRRRSPGIASSRRSRGWFRLGFALSALTATLLAAAYRHGTSLSADMPWAAESLSALASHVDRGRVLAEDHFGWISLLAASLRALSSG